MSLQSLPMCSLPRLLKCCQARTSPKFLKPEMRKLLASMGSAGARVAQILGILGKPDPCRCFRISGFRNFGILGKFEPADVDLP